MVETRRLAGSRNKKDKNPPVLSHDFIIQNHGDIMSCVLMVFIVGIMFPISAGLTISFVAPQYNSTYEYKTPEGVDTEMHGYKNGWLDWCTISFYTVAWIVVHAIIQEYVLDKLQRKAHLSKVSTFKFTESGHMLAFTAYAMGHAGVLISEYAKTNFNVTALWAGYPAEHSIMNVNYKLFYIFNIAYWIHQFPEFYFQKLKKEEMRFKTFVSAAFLVHILIAYFMNFTRVGVVLLFIEYLVQFIFHLARMFHYMDRKNSSKTLFRIYNIVFVLARLLTILIVVTVFWYGLRQSEIPQWDIEAGNFNSGFNRLNVMLFVITSQIILLGLYAMYHIGKFSGSKKEKKKSSASQPILPKKKRNDSQSETDTESKSLKKKN